MEPSKHKHKIDCRLLGLHEGISENDLNTFSLHLLVVYRNLNTVNASSPKNSLFRFVAIRAIERQ